MARVQGASCFGLFVVVVVVLALSVGEADAGLSFNHYARSCPNVETIVMTEVRKAFNRNPTIAPGILRMVFHDCFVRGCDGSVLLAGRNTERASPLNNRLHGFEVIDQVKAALEKACPGKVSCADILVYASRDSVFLTGGKRWRVMGGRRDGRISNKVEPAQNLPTGFSNAQELISTFSQKGLTPQQMVDLSGSHTIGVTHCEHIRNRIFTPVDRSMPKDLLQRMQRICPTRTTGTAIVLDQAKPHMFDTAYFVNVKAGRGLMTSDHDLYNADAGLRGLVDDNLNPKTFASNFGAAMFAMSNIEPTLAPDGEIRRRCQYRN